MTEASEGMMPETQAGTPPIHSNMDVAGIIRKNAGDTLDKISGVDAMVEELTKVLRDKITSFLMEDIEFAFTHMRMFDGLDDPKDEMMLRIRANGDEDNLIAAVLVNADTVRHVLAILFGGTKSSPDDFGSGAPRPSEASLFLLIVDQFVTGLVEAVDIVNTHGIPGGPAVASVKEFVQLTKERELVGLTFELGFEEDRKSFEFLVPLEIFDLLQLSKVEDSDEDEELSEEDIWSNSLTEYVDRVKIPMAVELSSQEMSLSKLGELTLGEKIVVNATPGGLRVFDESGAPAFFAKLEINNQKFGLRVVDAYQEEEA